MDNLTKAVVVGLVDELGERETVRKKAPQKKETSQEYLRRWEKKYERHTIACSKALGLQEITTVNPAKTLAEGLLATGILTSPKYQFEEAVGKIVLKRQPNGVPSSTWHGGCPLCGSPFHKNTNPFKCFPKES